MVFDETLMQFQADVLGVVVIRSRVHETTALGAVYALAWRPESGPVSWTVDGVCGKR